MMTELQRAGYMLLPLLIGLAGQGLTMKFKWLEFFAHQIMTIAGYALGMRATAR